MTESWIAKVDEDMIPEEGKEQAKVARASVRRRSSLSLAMGATVGPAD